MSQILNPEMEELFQKIKDRFPYLTEAKIQTVFSAGEIMLLNEGDVFAASGSRTQKSALILQGVLRNYIINNRGDQVTVRLATEMQSIAPYASVFSNKPATETTVAVEKSLVFAMDINMFKKLMETDADLRRLYTEIIEEVLLDAIGRIEDLTQKSPEQRYTRLIETQANLLDRVPLKYLASYLGITPVSLSRIRKRITKNRN